MTYIHDVVAPYDFPEKLPETGTLRANAAAFAAHGGTIGETYDSAAGKWGALPGLMSFPRSDKVFGGLEANVLPYADLVRTGLAEMAAALEAFADRVDEFRPRWEKLRQDATAFNALPQQPENPDEMDGGTTYRSWSASSMLQGRLQAAATDYRGYVTDCARGINDANQAMNPVWTGTTTQAFLAKATATWGQARTWLDRVGNVHSVNGKWGYRFSAEITPFSAADFLRGKMPDWLGDKVMGPAPDVPNGRLASVAPLFENGPLARFFGNQDPDRFSFRGGVDTTGNRLLVALGIPGATMPAWAKSTTNLARRAGDKLEKLGETKLVKNGGRVLGVVDAGLTYYDSFSEGYNESLREHPEWSPAEHRREAVMDAAIVGTAENAGKLVGGAVGRTAGAALGQAVIPIPGVGAAVGGFVGGIVGEHVGGVLGKGVGSFINDWREDGVGEALDNAKDSVVEGGKKVLGALNPFD